MSTESALDLIRMNVAKKGLIALKRVLDSAGFKDIEGLKDYELNSEVFTDSVAFYITVSFASIDDISRERLAKKAVDIKRRREEASTRAGAKRLVKRYTMRSDGRPLKIQGRYDLRRPVRDSQQIRKDARTTARERARKPAIKNAADRLIDHEEIMVSPRGMTIEDDKLHIDLERVIKEKDGKTILPQSEYQGIMRNVVDRIMGVITKEFVASFQKEMGQI
jgi:hypothetical protein